jgi:hypothetical protein
MQWKSVHHELCRLKIEAFLKLFSGEGTVMTTFIQKYHQAAFSYVGIGVVIVILTMVFIPEAHHRSGIVPLLIGIVVLLGLAYFLYRGVRWLAILLCLFAVGRSCWWIYSFFTFADEDTRWAYMMNAMLNIIVVYMLVRAAAEKKKPLEKKTA